MFKKICVIGLGYIGLPTASIFASRGIDVLGVDVSEHVVNTINAGDIHIVEPSLHEVVSSTVKSGHLKASLTPSNADAFLIAVPTPFNEERDPDVSYIESAVKAIASHVKKGDLIVLESTSPVGTTELIAQWLSDLRPDLSVPLSSDDAADIFIAHCPERVLPGRVMIELVENDRVIGGMTKGCADKAVELYKNFVKGECITTTCATAEMAKLAENSFRDVNIAYANELSMICDELGINVWELISITNLHPRVNILQPGPGVGGHCIAVDPWFIISKSPERAKVIKAARLVNDSKPVWVMDKIKSRIDEIKVTKSYDASEVSVCLLGLAFKPDIDDLRESPALDISVQFAQKHTGSVSVVEPNIEALPNVFDSMENVSFESDIDKAINDADLIVLLVDHKQFKAIPATRVAGKQVLDTRGVWDK